MRKAGNHENDKEADQPGRAAAIASHILEMQKGLNDLSYALFLSYALVALANQAAREMRDAC